MTKIRTLDDLQKAVEALGIQDSTLTITVKPDIKRITVSLGYGILHAGATFAGDSQIGINVTAAMQSMLDELGDRSRDKTERN